MCAQLDNYFILANEKSFLTKFIKPLDYFDVCIYK